MAQHSGALLLDGGMGLELKKRRAAGHDIAWALSLFSTAALRSTPDAVKELHKDYIRAGCQVVTTASYACTRFYLDKISEAERVSEMCSLSVRLAREAVEEMRAAGEVSVAASVPPLASSYSPNTQTEEEAVEQYTEIVQALRGADIYLIETAASVHDSVIAARVIREVCGPSARVWVSYVPMRNRSTVQVRCGTAIPDAVTAAAGFGAEAVLFNCATPELVHRAIRDAARCADAPRVGGYANFWEEVGDMSSWSIEKQETEHGAGDSAGGMTVRQDLTSEAYCEKVQAWIQDGASVIGGCCGIGPDTMEVVSRATGLGRQSSGGASASRL